MWTTTGQPAAAGFAIGEREARLTLRHREVGPLEVAQTIREADVAALGWRLGHLPTQLDGPSAEPGTAL